MYYYKWCGKEDRGKANINRLLSLQTGLRKTWEASTAGERSSITAKKKNVSLINLTEHKDKNNNDDDFGT